VTESAVIAALIDASVRALLVAAAVGVVLLWPHAREQGSLAHTAWTLVMLTMLMLPVLPKWLPALPIPLPQPTAMNASPLESVDTIQNRVAQGVAPTRTPSTANTASVASRLIEERAPLVTPEPARISTSAVVLFIWIAGVAVMLVRLAAGWRHAARLAARCSAERGEVSESVLVSTPVAIGVWTPRILVPASWRSWPAGLQNAVLVHERAHIRRRDMLVNLLAHANRCVYWFHPLAWWLERRIATTAEQACDDEVLRANGEAQSYAGLLVEMANSVRPAADASRGQGAGIMGPGALSDRVERILDGRAGAAITSAKRWTVIALTLSLLVPGIACRQPVPALRENPELAGRVQARPRTSSRARSHEEPRSRGPCGS
jgi:beta-lactamase regulating signal transducer with metallopeptidase domain